MLGANNHNKKKKNYYRQLAIPICVVILVVASLSTSSRDIIQSVKPSSSSSSTPTAERIIIIKPSNNLSLSSSETTENFTATTTTTTTIGNKTVVEATQPSYDHPTENENNDGYHRSDINDNPKSSKKVRMEPNNNNNNHDDAILSTNQHHQQQRIAQLTQELLQCNISYYIYNDPVIEQLQSKKRVLKPGKPKKPIMMKRYGDEVMAEIHIIEALKNHPLRLLSTYNNNNITTTTTTTNATTRKPDLYIIPLSLGVTIATARKASDAFDEALNVLYQQSTFQSKQGHDHVLLSLLVPLHKYRSHLREFNHQYPKLWNVTVATDVDWNGCQQLVGQVGGHDFEPDIDLYSHNMARYGFSLGLLAPNRNDTLGTASGTNIPLILATYEKFIHSQYIIFYHTRESESMHNSTIYRHAPLHIDAQKLSHALHPFVASIGHDLQPVEWIERYTDTKFCLVIRGDTIHSHALMRAVKVGCIPVIVADLYPNFAPTFRSTIDMHNYAVFLEEKSFIENPLRSLATLRTLSEKEIRNKLEWLAFAQRLFFPEHPSSLFVPAFLKEALRASRTPLGGTDFPYAT